MKESIKNLTQEIEKMVERRIRLEILKEQEMRLKKEMATVQKEIARLTVGKPTPVPKAKKIAGKSAKALLIEVFKRNKRPMNVKELTRKLLKKGYRVTRDDPSKTVDSALRANPDLFKKVAPGTFEYIG